MAMLVVICVFVAIFSLLTVVELMLLTKAGIDIVAHLRATYTSGKRVKFFFEAFGAIAFVLIQPIVLMATVVWAFGEVKPLLDGVAMLMDAFVQA